MKRRVVGAIISIIMICVVMVMVVVGAHRVSGLRINAEDIIPEIETVELTDEAIEAYGALVN